MFILYFIVFQLLISAIPGTDCQQQTSKILCYSQNNCYWLNHKKKCESLVQYNNAINPQPQTLTPYNAASSPSGSTQNNNVVVTDTAVASQAATVISNPTNTQASTNNRFTISGAMSTDNTAMGEVEKEIEIERQETESETEGAVQIPVFNPYIVPYKPSPSQTSNNGLQEYVPQYTTYTMNDKVTNAVTATTPNNNNNQNQGIPLPQPILTACKDQKSIHQCYHTHLVCWWDAPNKTCKIYPPLCSVENKNTAPTTSDSNTNNNNFQQTIPRNNNIPNVPISPGVSSRIPATGRRQRVEREIETELEPGEMEAESSASISTLPCGEQTTQANCLMAIPPDVLCYWTQENICEEAEECEDFPDASSCDGRNFMNNIFCEFRGGECAEVSGAKVLRLNSLKQILAKNSIEKQTDFGGLIFLGCIFLTLFSFSSVFWFCKKL